MSLTLKIGICIVIILILIFGNNVDWKMQMGWGFHSSDDIFDCDHSCNLEGFHGVDIDELVFSQEELSPDIKNRPITKFPLPLPLETIPRPKQNGSKIVNKELNYLEQLTKNIRSTDEKRKLCETIEIKGALDYFLKFAGSKGLVYDDKHLKKITKDVETLAYLMKSYYNRPRPYQLGFLLGKQINPVLLAKTSSYPCEHTMIAKVLAYQLQRNNPEFGDQLHSIAKRIELSRYFGGMNFPSDTVSAIKVADLLKDRMKYLKV